MAESTDARRADLRRHLIEAADRRISREGLAALRARDLARDAGCSVGAIYTVFADLDDLVFAVNSRTLDRLDAALRQASARTPDPARILIDLAAAYLDFAVSHRREWMALFEHHIPESREVPGWYTQQNARLIEHAAEPLGRLFADKPDVDTSSLARALFSAVHGIVLLGLEERFVAVPPGAILEQIEILVGAVLRGLGTQPGDRTSR
jgi:AcrR family transcriptional regulator